jgi:DNA-binding NtrC family response regulator
MQPVYRAVRNGCVTAQVAPAAWGKQAQPALTRVLVIDDDVTLAELLRVLLEDAGYQVVISDGSDIPKGAFDCVITDLVGVAVYSSEDARDWLLRVADRFPGVPLIVVTAHAEARDDPALAPRRVIMKPFDVDQIPAAIHEALAP